jgi:hypothetical protein
MMRYKALFVALLAVVALASCDKKTPPPGTNQRATVSLRDGTTFSGLVTKNSTSEITLQAENGESRTYPMSQVQSVQYVDANTAAATSPSTSAPSTSSTPPGSTPPATASKPSPSAAAPVPAAMPPSPADTARMPKPVENSQPAPVQTARTIPAGADITIRTNEEIDSKQAAPGQSFSGVIANDVVDTQGRVTIPRGANATLVVRSVQSQGKVKGQTELALDLGSVEVGGHRYQLETGNYVQKGREGVGKNKRTAEFIGGGTALGTIIGAIAGGGKGAAIGALSGAAAGTATQTFTRGKVRIPPETLLTFRLEAPVHIRQER